MLYPKNDLNVYDNKSAKLKFALSANSSTRTRYEYRVWLYNIAWDSFKARMTWTLIWAIMSSLLYLLSYSLNTVFRPYHADKGFAPLFTGHEPVMLLLHQSAFNYKKPSASIALASTDYKTVALLLC